MVGIRKAFNIMLAHEGINQSEAARLLNTPVQGLNKKLMNASMKYNEAEQIADHFGYDIVWIKRDLSSK